jgi:hypothetical protein
VLLFIEWLAAEWALSCLQYSHFIFVQEAEVPRRHPITSSTFKDRLPAAQTCSKSRIAQNPLGIEYASNSLSTFNHGYDPGVFP